MLSVWLKPEAERKLGEALEQQQERSRMRHVTLTWGVERLNRASIPSPE